MIKELEYLGFKFDVDFELHQEGLKWLSSQAQPTSEQIQAAGSACLMLNVKQGLSDLAAEKIALMFGKPAKSIDLLIKEMNLSNRCNELRDLLATATLTADEQAELDALNGYWTRVKAIRYYEKQRSLEVESTDLATFDINFGWPE